MSFRRPRIYRFGLGKGMIVPRNRILDAVSEEFIEAIREGLRAEDPKPSDEEIEAIVARVQSGQTVAVLVESSPPPMEAFAPPIEDLIPAETAHWIEVEVVYANGAPFEGLEYELVTPDGDMTRAQLDASGIVRADGFWSKTSGALTLLALDRAKRPEGGARLKPKSHDRRIEVSYTGALSVSRDRKHRIVVEPPPLVRIALDGFFHPGSAVFLPRRRARSNDEVATIGFAAVLNILELAPRLGQHRFLAVGHLSGDGGDALAEARARCVLDLVRGDRDAFVRAYETSHHPDDDDALLEGLARALGWPCDPGPDATDEDRRSSIEAFQRAYASAHEADLPATGEIDAKTRRAFVDAWDDAMTLLLAERTLDDLRPSLTLATGDGILAVADRHAPSTVGLSEHHDPNRVEALFIPSNFGDAMDEAHIYDGVVRFRDEPIYPAPFEIREVERNDDTPTRVDLPANAAEPDEPPPLATHPTDPFDFLDRFPASWNAMLWSRR